MCGICGIADFTGRPVDGELVRRMARVIAHRGPDGEGVVVDDAPVPQAALAARRLAIIDVEAGAQPLGNEDGTVWVAYNGEIYNFAGLQAELSSYAGIPELYQQTVGSTTWRIMWRVMTPYRKVRERMGAR